MKKYFEASYHFEYQLKGVKNHSSAELPRELEFLFFFLSGDQDVLVSPRKYSKAYIDYLRSEWSINLDDKLVTQFSGDIENWWLPESKIEQERWLNSKGSALLFKKRYQIDSNFFEFSPAHNFDKKLLPYAPKWIVKEVYGFSGRWSRIVDCDKLLLELENNKLNSNVVIEPWVERVMDFGVKVDSKDECKVYQLLNSSRGQFCGAIYDGESSQWALTLKKNHYQQLGHKLEDFYGPFFPFQIDGFFYRDEQGELMLRKVCEINHRITMVDLLWQAKEIKNLEKGICGIIAIPKINNVKSFQQLKDICSRFQAGMLWPLSDGPGRISFFFFHFKSRSALCNGIPSIYHSFSLTPPKWLSDQLNMQNLSYPL